ncbi:MAG: sigma-54-dependent Fis family transcriptional regulator [Candidatus Cloacimonetes bacterium]|nr:sigma-54-dependent Fis family transcriptional regulator [Candidatus Cloacimonadota bacterium]
MLIIDDDLAVQTSLQILFTGEGYECLAAEDPVKALQVMKKMRLDLILLDMNFGLHTSGQEGLALLQEIKQILPILPVILITGWGTISLAVEGMKKGAADFITKPWKNEHLLNAVRTSLKLSDEKKKDAVISRRQLEKEFDIEKVVGDDADFLKQLYTACRVSRTDATVLLLGESGTGKEQIAEVIHRNSLRKNQQFVKVNLGGISSSLFESEMFGHKKGAFTDALFDRKGRFEMADGGTVFLDEIGDLDPVSQVKMLRVLQDRSFEVLGSSQTRTVNVRVVCATNRDLEKMIASGDFREDLFYRINLVTIRLPALRERKGDIPLLAEYFLDILRQRYRRPAVHFAESALDWLSDQSWPGNIRELKNLLERTVVVSNHDRISKEELSSEMKQAPRIQDLRQLENRDDLTLEDMEKERILQTLQKHNYNISQSARVLGLSRGALYRRLEKFGITL